MAKDNNKNKSSKNTATKDARRSNSLPSTANGKAGLWVNSVILGVIAIITFWCYHYSLNNTFINSWDDSICCDLPFIKSFSSENLKMMLFHNISPPNFHPVSMLSIALNWHFEGPNPEPFYLTEIILHLSNTILVFFLSLALFNEMAKRGYGNLKGIPYLAGLCALWHGIHPMHVESVSWAAERKDVLYLFFYLLGLLVYVKYVTENKRKLLVLVSLLFILSLFSKSLAVVFPLSLFTIDILLKRKLDWRLLIEKIPFFIISLIVGCITFVLQKQGGYIISSQMFSVSQRIMFAGHNYLMYLVKFFVPSNLCSYYPYPVMTTSNAGLPVIYYFAPFLAIGITLGLLYLAYKKGKNYFRVTLFGFGFYLFNVMFVLQLVGAGPTIMADRYSYASYIGLTFMFVYFMNVLIQKIPAFKILIIALAGVYSIILAWLCETRTHVWHNTETLWGDVIQQYPNKVLKAYNNLGDYYMNHGDFDRAYEDLSEAINLKTINPKVYCNMGIIMSTRKQYEASVQYFNESLNLDSNDAITYLDRGLNFYITGKNMAAIADLKHSLQLASSPKCLFYLSKTYYNMNDFTDAIKYAELAQNAQYPVPDDYIRQLKAHI